MIETAREFQKNIYSASLTMLKSLIVWIIVNCGKYFKRWESQKKKKRERDGNPRPPYLSPEKSVCRSRINS